MGSVLKTQISQRKLANLFLLILNGARTLYITSFRGLLYELGANSIWN